MDRHDEVAGTTRSWGKLFFLPLVVLASFSYGFASARYRIFPYGVILRTYAALVSASSRETGGDGEVPDDPRPGLWLRARDDLARGSTPDMEAVRELAGLGYMDGYEPAPGVANVTLFDRDAAYDGLNLVVSGHAPWAALMDMRGEVLHEWSAAPEDVWPDRDDADDVAGHETFWRRAYVFPNGDLLAIYDGIGMIKLARNSELIWANMGRIHHDMYVDERGFIYTLSRHERAEHDRFALEGPIEEDFITILRPDGVEESRTSILSCFLDSDYYSVISLAARRGDILHTNTIELMDGRFVDRHPSFARGNVLISVPTLNTIAVVDLQEERVEWALSGQWQFQHQPTMLDNGNILLFDNLGESGRSKVIEIDPLTQEIVWAYRDSPEHPLSSFFLGSCQRLSNGNTLITESAMGRAFEVTSEGRVVWEYLNPHRAGKDGQLIASLLEVVRIEHDAFSSDFAAALRAGSGRRQPASPGPQEE